jgi:serine/threonine protein kinase
MSLPSSDRNLLVGILAIQLDFIRRDQLIAAMHAWVLEKKTPLEELLERQGAVDRRTRKLLEDLVERHLEAHENDAEKSLGAVSSIGSVKGELRSLADPQLNESLGHVAVNPDPLATLTPVVGSRTSEGQRFRILKQHAKGGLGVVHVALDTELNREVALKEIQAPHADQPDSRARFTLEAEITGGLEHPGIVPVYGLGTYADGRPYYAMRFIRGDSLQDAIDRYYRTDWTGKASERSLALRNLLGRFVDVCNAISYAHSRGVLHRDLKPGNIMLGKYGETLVVDWGLAKPVGKRDPESDESTLRPKLDTRSMATQIGTVWGTPAYMSPEQAAGRLVELGPVSDVYSLGATLYSLLTGEAPYKKDKDTGELLRKVQSGELRRPRSLRPGIPRSLEAICLKAMALQPADRYATPAELADDIEHWLADEPVSAVSETLVERSARLFRKHKSWALASAVVAATLLVASIVSTGFWIRARLAAQQANQEAENARESFELLLMTFRGAYALDAPGIAGEIYKRDDDRTKNLVAERTLVRLLRQSRDTYQSKPLLLAKLLDTAGNVYRSWADYPRARSLLDEALKMRQEVNAPELEIAESLHSVGRCYHDLGHYDEARKCYEAALESRRQNLTPDNLLVNTTKFNLAWLLAETRDPKAEPVLREVIKSGLQRGDQPQEVALARLALAAIMITKEEYSEAAAVVKEVLTELARRPDDLLNDLAKGLLAHAELRLRELLQRGLRKLALGVAKPVASEPRFDEFSAIVKKHVGARHPYYAVMLYQSSLPFITAKDDKQAGKYLEECLEIIRETVGFGHPMAILPLHRQADILASKGEFGKGEALYTELQEKRKELFGEKHPLFAEALFKSAHYIAGHGGAQRLSEAQGLLVKANQILTDPTNRDSQYAHRIQLFRDTQNGQWIQIAPAALSRDAKQLLIAEQEGDCRLWLVDTGKPFRTLEESRQFVGLPPKVAVSSLAFSSDGTRALTCTADGAVVVWDTQSGEIIRQGPGVTCFATFSNDGERVLSGHSNGELRLWTLSPEDEGKLFKKHSRAVIGCVVLPDGETACSFDDGGTLCVWNIDTGQDIDNGSRKIEIAKEEPVAISPGSKRLVRLNSRNRTIDLWDIATDRRIKRYHIELFRRAGGSVRSVSFSPDGRFAVCGVDDGFVYVFQLPASGVANVP